jgi:hypothetical protein
VSIERNQLIEEIRGDLENHLGEQPNLEAGDGTEDQNLLEGGSPEPEGQTETGEVEAVAPDGEQSDNGEHEELGETFTVAQLAKAIAADPEMLYTGLTLKLPNTGEELTLEQVKDRLQAPQQDAEQLEQARQQLERDRQAVMQQAQQFLGAGQQLSEAEQKAMRQMALAEAEYERIDWEKLDKANPGRKASEEQRLAALYAAGKRALGEAQQYKQQLLAQQEQQAGAYYWHRTLERIPDYRDQAKAAAGLAADGQYLTSIGYQPQELSGPVDDRFALMAHEARQWREYQAKLGEAQKQVRKSPQMLKPGAGRRTVGTAQRKRTEQLTQRARETGRREDKVAALRAELGFDRK